MYSRCDSMLLDFMSFQVVISEIITYACFHSYTTSHPLTQNIAFVAYPALDKKIKRSSFDFTESVQ